MIFIKLAPDCVYLRILIFLACVICGMLRTHDTCGLLSCPTLIIGGTDGGIVTGRVSEEIAERITSSELFLYEGLGHGLYE